MKIRESDAREKWCPHVRLIFKPTFSETISNRGERDDRCRCLGAECMAWVDDGGGFDEALQEMVMYGHCGLIFGADGSIRKVDLR